MNSDASQTKPFPQPGNEPRIRDYAMAAALVVGACASIAIAFTAIATGYAVDGVIKRIFRRGGRHVPR
jgi:hypothetical protein